MVAEKGDSFLRALTDGELAGGIGCRWARKGLETVRGRQCHYLGT